jgi:hypothetical protein
MTLVTIPNRPAGTDQRSIELILADFDAITDVVNGHLDSTNMEPSFLAGLGPSVAAKSIIVPSEFRTNTAYGLMTTPDEVAGVVLPTNGLIIIRYQAVWAESVSGAARAAIFIGSNQLEVQQSVSGGHGPGLSAAATNGATANIALPLSSCALGLAGVFSTGGFSADAATGQAVGAAAQPQVDIDGTVLTGAIGGFGNCEIFATAGTYTVSVQFKASSGNVTVGNRKLWVSVIA